MVSVSELLQEHSVKASRRLVETQVARRERGGGARAREIDEILTQKQRSRGPSRTKSKQHPDAGTTPSAKNTRRDSLRQSTSVEPSDAEFQQVPCEIGAKF